MTHEVGHPRRVGRVPHGPGLGRVERERLLADDVTAGLDRGDGERRVGVGRRRDRHRDHVVAGERPVEVGERVRHPGPLGPPGGAVGIRAHEPDDVEPRRPEGRHVDPAPEPGADDDRPRAVGHQ